MGVCMKTYVKKIKCLYWLFLEDVIMDLLSHMVFILEAFYNDHILCGLQHSCESEFLLLYRTTRLNKKFTLKLKDSTATASLSLAFKSHIWCLVRCFTLNNMRHLINIHWYMIGPSDVAYLYMSFYSVTYIPVTKMKLPSKFA